MNNAKAHALTHLGIGGTLFGLSFFADGWNEISLITIAVLFTLSALMFFISMRFKARWLLRATETIGSISLNHLVIFLILYGVGLTLLQNNVALPGAIFVLAAYFILALGIVLALGREVLQPILLRLDSKRNK
jgi:O-antigen/teichoic acid export membrane protein